MLFIIAIGGNNITIGTVKVDVVINNAMGIGIVIGVA